MKRYMIYYEAKGKMGTKACDRFTFQPYSGEKSRTFVVTTICSFISFITTDLGLLTVV